MKSCIGFDDVPDAEGVELAERGLTVVAPGLLLLPLLPLISTDD
jgi:hypothetical protein